MALHFKFRGFQSSVRYSLEERSLKNIEGDRSGPKNSQNNRNYVRGCGMCRYEQITDWFVARIGVRQQTLLKVYIALYNTMLQCNKNIN